MNQCPSEDELLLLAIGDATENRAAELRAHGESCARCRTLVSSTQALTRALAAPVASASDPERLVAQIVARVEAGEAPSRRARGAWLGAFFATAAAALLLFVLRPHTPDDAFVARGGPHTGTLRRQVGVSVLRVAEQLAPLQPHETVRPETAYGVAYTNLGARAFLLVFAIDAAGTVHWIQPAYLDAAAPPSALPLEHREQQKVLPSAGILDQPAPGPLRIVTLLAPHPLSVTAIESLTPEQRTLAALRTRFADAQIDELVLTLAPSSSPRSQP